MALDGDALRQEALAKLPAWYSPLAHFLFPTAFGLGSLLAAALVFRRIGLPTALELITLPLTFILANAAEWRLHKSLMHRPNRVLPIFHERHTLQHHRIYKQDDMALKSWNELALIMFPPYAIAIATVAALIPGVALWLFELPRPAVLFVSFCACYVMAYEWLHTSFTSRLSTRSRASPSSAGSRDTTDVTTIPA